MRPTLLRYLLIFAVLFCFTHAAFSEGFNVWEKISPCQDTRQDWFTVSVEYPGSSVSTNSWQFAAGPFATFAEAMAAADKLKLQPLMTKFRNRCCDDWSVFIRTNNGTDGSINNTFSVARASQPPTGGPFTLFRAGFCCEQAFDEAGIAVGSIRDCRNVQLSDGSTVTVQPDGSFVPFSGTTTGSPTLLGCFHDPNNPYDLDGYLERSQQNTPQRCIDICKSKGFAYAGVQYGESCLCGNSYGKFGPAKNPCNYPCTGDRSQICGGNSSNSVYSTAGANKGGGGCPNSNACMQSRCASACAGQTPTGYLLCVPAGVSQACAECFRNSCTN